jgi:lysozyme family protein
MGRRGAATLVAVMALGAGGALAASTGGSAPTGAKAQVNGSTSLLRVGSSGPAVAALQRALGITADGAFGPVTRRAVKRLQRAKGLTVDGIAGPATLAALGIAASAAPQVRTKRAALLERIAECESGGNPAAISRTGRYRGKYQFSRATWRAMGGKGDPAKASEAEQDARAAQLLARHGLKPWPHCGPRAVVAKA